MWNTIKDYFNAIFYVAGAVILAALIFMMGAIIFVPLLIYGTYRVFQIQRELRNIQQPKHKTEIRNVYYTTHHSDSTGDHKSR